MVAGPQAPPARLFWRRQSVRKLIKDRSATASMAILGLILIATAFAGIVIPHDPFRFVGVPLESPSVRFPLGTDELGRDILSRVIYGGRISLSVGLIASVLAVLVGTPLGLLSGYYGGRLDTAIMRILDGLLAFPAILLALAIVSVLGPNVRNLVLAISLVFVPIFARLIRASVLSLKEKEFVEGARALGSSDAYIMARVILPNCLSPIFVQFSLSFAAAILIETGLTFLGMGAQPPTPTWGGMLNTGRRFLSMAPLYSIAPGMAVFLTVLSLNLIGDALRDALDPRLRVETNG